MQEFFCKFVQEKKKSDADTADRNVENVPDASQCQGRPGGQTDTQVTHLQSVNIL